MPTEIDDLRIKINAQADTANAAIDNLVDKLDALTSRLGKIDGSKLTGLANGVSAFGNAVKLVGSVDKRNFDKLAANITKIASINTESINRAASSMNQLRNGLNSLSSVSQNAVQISEIAANISKLGGKNVTNAITNLPLLTTELNKFMSVMANSPQVSKNIIDMTNALANLAGQGRSVGAATNTLTNGLNKSDRTITKTSKSTLSLAAAFGKFYATYFLVLRGIKGLWSSIEKTADYFEAFNYFNVAFNKIANEWKGDWEKYGKELGITTSKAYAESFTDRMEDAFSKLSGVQFDTETGLLSETGTKNLGMNIQQITQYASQLASVTNSLELTGEASVATSQAFTKLAGDMSSLFNVDYADVSANLQSGLIGQSRALYKYGIDITNATLQTKAYELGLTKAVSEMTQGEKAQLRLLSILEQSKIAWGDQANTINSLSNQMRLLKNGWSETSMVFGQLFVPLLENALPIVNGMVIALKRLLINVAGFMGVKIDPNKFNTGLNNNEEVLDGITDGFEDATAAAKEYENQILGFDEITKLQDTTATVGVSADGSGIDLTAQILDATSEYEKVWNEAYNNMENRANEWADKISEYFSVGNWFDVGEDVSGLATGIFDFFSNAIDDVDWNKLGSNVGDFLAGIDWFDILVASLKFKFNIAKALAEAWTSSFEEAPIETALLTTLGFMKFTSLGNSVSGRILNAIKTPLTNAWGGGKLLTELFSASSISSVATGSFATVGLTIGSSVISGLVAAFVGWEGGQLISKYVFGEDWATDMSFEEQITYLQEAFTGIDTTYESMFKISDEVQDISDSFSNLLTNVNNLRQESNNNLTSILGNVDELNILKDKYFELANNQELSADKQLLLIGYAKRLTELVPSLSDFIDKETGQYKGQREELEKLIETKKQQMLQEIATKRQAEILEQIVDLEMEYAKVADKVDAAEKRQEKRRKQYETDRNILQYEQNELLKEKQRMQDKLNSIGLNNVEAQYYRDVSTAIMNNEEALKKLSTEYLKASASDAELIKSSNALKFQLEGLQEEYDNYQFAINNAITDTKEFADVVANGPEAYNVDVNVDTNEATSKINNVFSLLGKIKDKSVLINADTSKIDSVLNNLRTKLLNFELPTLDIKALIKTDLDEKAFKDAVDKMGSLGALSSNFFSPSIKSSLSIGSFATGGFVDSYSLFMAGENGIPEILGTVGGRTAVAGGAEITGIREEIRSTADEEIALLRQQNELLQGILEKQYGISYRDVGRAVKRYSTEYRMQTGQSLI